jgi:uncharacterized membrane protein YecN with MAPEG domain
VASFYSSFFFHFVSLIFSLYFEYISLRIKGVVFLILCILEKDHEIKSRYCFLHNLNKFYLLCYLSILHHMHSITLFYASIFGLLFVILSIRTILARRRSGISLWLSDHTEDSLTKKARVHANFSEYIPLSLILMLLAEDRNLHFMILHCIGISLLIGRLFHIYWIDRIQQNFTFRVVGMALTLTTLTFLSFYLLLSSLGIV